MIGSINNNYKPTFKGVGVTSALVGFFGAIAKGGKAAEFLMQDVLACGVPRTVSSLNRNKEKLGHPNYVAGAETAIREGLTGSSLFLVPMACLAIASKLTGKANNIQAKSIIDLSNIIKKTNLEGNARGNFYNDVFRKVGENINLEGDKLKEFADTFAKGVAEIEKAPKRNILKRMFSKEDIGAKDQLLEKLTDSFVKIKKENVADFKGSLNAAKLSEGNEVGIEKLVKYVKDYADDFIDGKKCKMDIDKFRHLRVGSRLMTTIGLFIATVGVLVVLPKLYSISKTNPEAEIDAPEAKEVK